MAQTAHKTDFFASWRDYDMRADVGMTRERMARLMRAWRNSKTQGWRNFKLDRIGAHNYRVEAIGYPGEWHYVKWVNE